MTADPSISSPDKVTALPHWLVILCRALIALALPPFLVLTGVRLVMSEQFLRLEYNRPGFPPDRYGFTQAERLEYAPFTVRYLLNNEDTDYLAQLEHQGASLFTGRELRHMHDVQVVTRAAFRVHWAVMAILLAAGVALAWRSETRRALRQGFRSGGVLTIALMLTVIVLVVANWDFFFTGFHRVFFEGDSWLFSTRATLIRLFPERFWFDAAIAIGAVTFAGAVIAILAATISGSAARSAR